MEQVGDLKFIDFEEILDRELGKVGTPKRDAFESSVSLVQIPSSTRSSIIYDSSR